MSTLPQASAAPSGTAWPLASGRPELASGPRVALVFQRAFALVLIDAWVSLARQVPVLIGSRGLLPASDLFERAGSAGYGGLELPSLFWLGQSDFALELGTWLGVGLAVLSLFGVRPRLCFLLSAPLYLSYTTACSDFTAFQWDNMLVEVAVLAACLPVDRPARLAHVAFRVLLFKLYFESGIAKWQSHLHDWQDGSAMSFYYETAPLPARLAFYAHQLPAAWHRLESWGALVLELFVPFFVFGPRALRLCAFAAFSAFQIVNTATANYGFFTYLTLTLHLFLLGERDLARLGVATPAGLAVSARRRPRLRDLGAVVLFGLWLAGSWLGALFAFQRSDELEAAFLPIYQSYEPFRVANVYHLFGHITRERIEPQFETEREGRWQEHDLWYKPGRVTRPPPYVAPHQPRVDFRLWFYGLSFGRGTPRYVGRLLERLCQDPDAVQPLFVSRLPRAPDAVRIRFYRYHFADRTEHARSGAYWTRELVSELEPRNCR